MQSLADRKIPKNLSQVKNAFLMKKEDGYWMSIKGKSGRSVCINLSCMMRFGTIIGPTFEEWARDHFE